MRQHPALTVAQAPALTGKRLTPSLAIKYILNGLPFTANFLCTVCYTYISRQRTHTAPASYSLCCAAASKAKGKRRRRGPRHDDHGKSENDKVHQSHDNSGRDPDLRFCVPGLIQ